MDVAGWPKVALARRSFALVRAPRDPVSSCCHVYSSAPHYGGSQLTFGSKIVSPLPKILLLIRKNPKYLFGNTKRPRKHILTTLIVLYTILEMHSVARCRTFTMSQEEIRNNV